LSDLWNKARQAAEDARTLFRAGGYDGACNRAYYAMYNAARALLVARGVSPEKAKRHATILRLFSAHFVKDGPFGAEYGRTLGNAARARVRADYSTSAIQLEVAQDVMNSLDEFMTTAQQVIETEIRRGTDS
jgi:uncharacterized protein (UPF0332 family)